MVRHAGESFDGPLHMNFVGRSRLLLPDGQNSIHVVNRNWIRVDVYDLIMHRDLKWSRFCANDAVSHFDVIVLLFPRATQATSCTIAVNRAKIVTPTARLTLCKNPNGRRHGLVGRGRRCWLRKERRHGDSGEEPFYHKAPEISAQSRCTGNRRLSSRRG